LLRVRSAGHPIRGRRGRGPAFRALVGEIDNCIALAELAARGNRLYALRLSRDQAGVAWTHYTLRKAALEAAVTLGRSARTLVDQIERAGVSGLPALGARLYRVPHGGNDVSADEWRRIWHAYHTRRASRAA
jgi:hypothetical protein